MTTAEKTTDTAKTHVADGDIARKIWLAGVGAYGRMYSQTQGAVEKLASGANEAFDELVAKGEEIEDKVRDAIAKSPRGERLVSLVETATSKVQEITAERGAALKGRVEQVRKAVSQTLAPWDVAGLGHAVEKLTVQVEALTAEVAALKAKRAAAPKAPAAKAAKTA